MKTKLAVTCAAVVAACGGQSAPLATPTATPAVAPSSGAATTAAPAAAPDPALAFRQQFHDPGGMWMPSQMTLPQHVDTFARMGVKLDPAKLADPLEAPLAAVVYLGGCTGSFVSPEGLVVTNHHCVQGALQLNSKDGKNYVADGFLAKTKADEPSAGPAQRVMVAQAYTDVSKTMRDGLDAIVDPEARKLEADKRSKKLVAECEKAKPGIRCQVSSFFRGDTYLLIEMLEIRDVRLVYAPARSVGNYGGEIDNWEWPRHTGDWSFYRAYVGKDGKPADYSPDNVPYRPKHWLEVSTAGLKPGDFVMVAGYPARTNRTVTASEMRHDVEVGLPYRLGYYEDRYKLAEAHLKDGGETTIKATVMKQGVQNGLEKVQGILQGLRRNPALLAQKDALDEKVKAWANEPAHAAQKKSLDRLEALLADERRTERADFDREATLRGSALLAQAIAARRWAEERAKKDADRKPGFQDRDLPRARAAAKQLSRQYDRTLDRATFRLMLLRAARLPEAERPWLSTLLGSAKGQAIDEALVDRTLDAWYKSPLLEDEKARLELIEKGTPAKLAASTDPFLKAAHRVWPIYVAAEKKDDARTGEKLLLMPVYMQASKEVLGGALAPDANATLRVTYGTVRSLKPESTAPADSPFTVASQILGKDTGKDPFDSPERLLAAIKAKSFGPYADPSLGGDLPVDFLSDLDITGGNSGSPTMNDKGQLVGLAFDGNKEGLASDVVFDGTTTRSIHVDARYMIWTMETIDGAKHLVKEMGIEPKMP